ncbi:MAG: glycosyltransferase family 39 protein [Anaerolineae bacterium]
MSSRWFLAVATILYGLLGTYQLSLPGPNQDEALDAVPAMQVVLDQRLDNEATLRLGDSRWPIMVMPYVGCTSTYTYIPWFALLGVSARTLRLANLFTGLLTLLVIWGFLRSLFDERLASLATLLLAVNPTYVFWTRMGAYVALPLLPLAILTLWALLRWYQGRGGGYLIAAGFCLGLGLSTKILFLWFWAALGLAWLLLTPRLEPGRGWRRWLWPLRRSGIGTWALAGLAALVGAAPLIAYNVQTQFYSLRFMLRNAVQTELYGVNNLDLAGNLGAVLGTDLRQLLDGSWYTEILGPGRSNPLGVVAPLLAGAVLIYLARKGRLPYAGRRLALLAVLAGTVIFLSAFTITGLGAMHLLIVWPFPQVLISAALCAGFQALPKDRLQGAGRAALFLAAAVLVGAEAGTTVAYHADLARSGGLGAYSDAIYALATDLDQPSALQPVALDWGFRRNLQLLTQGRVNPEEGYDYTQTPGDIFRAYINRRVTEAPALYLFHSPEFTAFSGHWELFEEAAYSTRQRPVLWKRYAQRDGTPWADAYVLEDVPRAYEAPAMQTHVDVRLGDQLALVGYDSGQAEAALRPGEVLRLTLYWQALEKPAGSYKVFVHLVDGAGTLRAQHDGKPVNWGYPTDVWEAQEVVDDRVRLALPADAPEGDYQLYAGMYDEATGERLTATLDGMMVEDGRIPLGTIHVSVGGEE